MRAPPLPLWRMTRARYDRLVDVGIFGPEDRVELLDGLLVAREPQGELPRHGRRSGARRARAGVRPRLPHPRGEADRARPAVRARARHRRRAGWASRLPDGSSLATGAHRRGGRDIAQARPAAQGRSLCACRNRRVLDRRPRGRGAGSVSGPGPRYIRARRMEVRFGARAPAQRGRHAARRAPGPHPRRLAPALTAASRDPWWPCTRSSGEQRYSKKSPAHHDDERSAVHHWITSSARTRMDCGIVRPSAFAVFRLMTSSNLVGCSTGRSAGFAPFRILSTKIAARRQMSLMSAPYEVKPPASTYSRRLPRNARRSIKARSLDDLVGSDQQRLWSRAMRYQGRIAGSYVSMRSLTASTGSMP